MTNTNTTHKTLRIDLPNGLAILEPVEHGVFYDVHNVWAELGCPSEYAPSKWLQTDTAKANIKALQDALGDDIPYVKIGDDVPVLLAWEPLVYNYVMWACPEYNARVTALYTSAVNGRYDLIDQMVELVNSQMDEKVEFLKSKQ